MAVAETDIGESGRRILLVDDDADARAIMRVMLSSSARRYEITEARAGEEALVVLRRFKPDLVLLDIALPGEDGLAVLRGIKHDHATRSTPVILVSAHAEQRMVRAGLVSGADEYLIKPITRERLLGAVDRLLGGQGPRPSAAGCSLQLP